MAVINANGIKIEYEFHGNRNHPIVILVHGLGMPLAAWPMPMINRLVNAGYYVLRFDHRDIGKSQKFDHLPMPNVPLFFLKHKLRFNPKTPYELNDLMKDAIGLLDALNIQKVHLVGISMGGMIAQLMAIHTPQRIKSLTSIMSTTGNRKLPSPERHISRHLMSRPKSNSFDDLLDYHVKTFELIGSPAYPIKTEHLRDTLAGVLRYGMSSTGTTRQLLAILSAPDRILQLRKLEVPSLVIHGKADPLVKIEAGQETANAIPNAKFYPIEGMGHNLPEPLLAEICGQIISHISGNE